MKTFNKETIKDIFVNGFAGGFAGRPRKALVNSFDVNAVSFTFHNQAAAESFAAHFPKYCKARIGRISIPVDDYRNMISLPHINFSLDVGTSNGVTGDMNEAALKRHQKVFQILETLGLTESMDQAQ